MQPVSLAGPHTAPPLPINSLLPIVGRSRHAVKVCGATTDRDIARIADGGADLVGIWYDVPGGAAAVDDATVIRLARSARRTGRLEPVLVTCSDDTERLAALVGRAGIPWVQLHAYQRPATVARLKAAAPGCRVMKVLHLSAGICAEQHFIGRYELAGVDLFLADVVIDGRIGSTGHDLPPEPSFRLLDSVTRPVMLAGGLSAGNSPRYGLHRQHFRYFGADFDSNARDDQGRISVDAVAALAGAWGRLSLPLLSSA